jgi:hypothetical protein
MMYLPPGAFSEDKLIEFLLECPIEREVSGAIESFCDRYTVSSENRAVFERFLASRSLDNRVMALEALIFHGGFGGYEADCVLLHYQARLDPSSQVIFDAIRGTYWAGVRRAWRASLGRAETRRWL